MTPALRPIVRVWRASGLVGLVHAARSNPEAGFIGCEAFLNGMAGILAAIEAEKLDNVRASAAVLRELLQSGAPLDALRQAYSSLEAATFELAEAMYGGTQS